MDLPGHLQAHFLALFLGSSERENLNARLLISNRPLSATDRGKGLLVPKLKHPAHTLHSHSRTKGILVQELKSTRIREQLHAIKMDGTRHRECRARQIVGPKGDKIQGRSALSIITTKPARSGKRTTNRNKDREREVTQRHRHALI
jgi:hypothetical protein